MRDTINVLEQEFGIEMTLARRRAMTQSILDDIWVLVLYRSY